MVDIFLRLAYINEVTVTTFFRFLFIILFLTCDN